jgi:hypothetical protein
MKKVFFILGVLLSLGMFWACSSDDEVIDENGGQSQITINDTISNDADSCENEINISECYEVEFRNKGEENATALVCKKPDGIEGPNVNDYLVFPIDNINLNNIKEGDHIMIRIISYMYVGVFNHPKYGPYYGRYLCEVEPCE